MNNLKKRFINRLIARIYLLTNSNKVRLFLLNSFSRFLVNKKNRIIYDREEKLFWLKNGDHFLPPVKSPNFHFNVDRFEYSVRNYICKKYEPKNRDVILDLGAGVGEELYFFSKRIQGEGKLYSIEPSPENYRYLDLLKKKQSFTNCYNFNLAISNYNGTINIKEDDFYLLKRVDKFIEGVQVPCCTLDTFVQRHKIQKIDLLKVNIEGAELEMIEGMDECLKIIENIAVSCHDFLQLPTKENIKGRLINFFEKNNFKVYTNGTGEIIEDSWIYAEKIR